MNQIKNTYSLDILLDAGLLLYLYRNGLFPMADSKYDKDIYIVEPEVRGIIPIDTYKPSKSLLKLEKKGIYEIRQNTCFDSVIKKCASREDTWINDEIISLYCELYELGYAHSFEVFNDKQELVGGLYGIAINKAFFGESMFSIEPNTSKLALYHLIKHLKANDYILLDTQFQTPHLESMGCIAIPQEKYMKLLKSALD